MSILAGRLAATEGAYFLQESKRAVGRLAQKLPSPKPDSSPASPPPPQPEVEAADVLPEILRHSLPLKGGAAVPDADPSLSAASKWLLRSPSSSSSFAISRDSLNPLRAYVKLPQATFGPKRWQIPDEQPIVSASKANDLRRDRYSSIDSEKLKALAIGYIQIGKAFAIATTLVFGGATVMFAYTAHKLQMSSADDVRTKGKDLIQPGADRMREKMVPLRAWAEKMSRKWRIEDSKEVEEKSIIKELSKTFSAKTYN